MHTYCMVSMLLAFAFAFNLHKKMTISQHLESLYYHANFYAFSHHMLVALLSARTLMGVYLIHPLKQ